MGGRQCARTLIDPSGARCPGGGGHDLPRGQDRPEIAALEDSAGLDVCANVYVRMRDEAPELRARPGPGAFTRSPGISGSRTSGHCPRRAAATTSPASCDGWRRAITPARSSSSVAVRVLWAARLKAGQVLGWDRPAADVGSRVPTLLMTSSRLLLA